VVIVEIDLELKESSHIMFADMNNGVLAGLLSDVLKRNKLDKYEESEWKKFFSW